MQLEKTAQLTRLVREEVKAQMKRYIMSKKREDFINHLTDVLGPGLSHHYRATLGILNHRADQVVKWQRQEEGFLRKFMDRLVNSTKAKGLDRKKAVDQALREMMENDGLRRRVESAHFQKTYQLKRLTPLPENAHEDFLVQVREILNALFPP